MIATRAQVVGIDGEHALVETSPAGGCSSCGMQSGCGASRLGRLLPGRTRIWRVPNAMHARAGEEVVLGLPEEAMLSAAFAAYGPPLVGALAASVAAFALAGGDAWPVLAAAGGFVGGLAVSRRLARRRPLHHAPRMIARRSGPLPVRFVPTRIPEGEQT